LDASELLSSPHRFLRGSFILATTDNLQVASRRSRETIEALRCFSAPEALPMFIRSAFGTVAPILRPLTSSLNARLPRIATFTAERIHSAQIVRLAGLHNSYERTSNGDAGQIWRDTLGIYCSGII